MIIPRSTFVRSGKQCSFVFTLIGAFLFVAFNDLDKSVTARQVEDAVILGDKDSDGDGLSDFHEKFKYLTDPRNADTDSDGIVDGDWKERREHQYAVRTVVQVMKPVTIEYITDDYQDARILDETDNYVELEVIHFPMNKVSSAITADENWRETVSNSSELKRWLEPGPTSDLTPELKNQIIKELEKDGIDLDTLNDKETVEKVSKWLLKRAKYEDGFSTFITAFDKDGQPYIPEELSDAPDRSSKLTPKQQWEREVSAVGMYKNRVRGSCTSSAIYLCGCLRAIGIPTRTILCIPVLDASDAGEMRLLSLLQQTTVRRDLVAALTPLNNSWASHTFNEVYVGKRWRRLNYDRLGQNIYDPGMFGLMTHVATLHDWADARMWETIGRRQKLKPKDVFGGSNPYSTISLRDEIGKHCKIIFPKPEIQSLVVKRLYWTDSADLPEDIRENCKQRDRFGLIAEVGGFGDRNSVPGFLSSADLRVFLHPVAGDGIDKRADDANRLGIGFDSGCYWLGKDLLRIYVPFGAGDVRDLVEGVEYEFRARNQNQDFQWQLPEKLTVVRETKQ